MCKEMQCNMTKNTIIITALRLFLLRGYKNVSLVDVAKEMGITKGGIYHYFGSKEDLFQVGICYLFGQFETKYVEALGTEKSVRETLRFLLGGELEFYIEGLLNIKQGDYRANNASLALEIMHNFPNIQEEIDRSQLEVRDTIAKKMQRAQETGEIRKDLDAQHLATLVLATSSGLNVLGRNLNTPLMRQQIIDSVWRLIGA